jgi:hypothetical protein
MHDNIEIENIFREDVGGLKERMLIQKLFRPILPFHQYDFFVTSAVLVIFFRMTISIKVTTIFQRSFGNEL